MLTILEKVKGDGGSGRVTEDELTRLKSEIEQLKSDAEEGIWTRRQWNDNVRLCKWDGQSEDGRKHREAMQGREPHPFEGASDARIRLADMVVNENAMLYAAAARRADLLLRGMELTDEPWSARMRTLMRFMTRGRHFRREIRKLGQYLDGDSPAMALLGVFWHRETAIRTQELALDGFIAQAWAVQTGGAPEDAGQMDEDWLADMQDLVRNENREEEALLILEALLGGMTESRARKVLRAWRADEVAEFPEAYEKPGRVRFRAMRMFDDAFIPINTAEFDDARVVFVREWLSAAAVQAKVVTDGWSRRFVKQVLAREGEAALYEGKTAFPETVTQQTSTGTSETVTANEAEDYKGLYEIIYPYWRAVNDDGIPGVYWTVMHHAVDMAGVDRQLCEETEVHGRYPFVDFEREVLNDRLVESRGIPELVMTDQEALKRDHDATGDHAQLSIPPIFVPNNRPNIPLEIGPMTQIRRRRQHDYEWMKLPDYPRSAERQQRETMRRVNEYVGRWDPEVDDRLVTLKQQDRVDNFLCSLGDGLIMAAQLGLAKMPDEQIFRIVGGKGFEVNRMRTEIQGMYDLDVDFDVRNLDPEYVLKLAEALQKYMLPLDQQGVVQRDQVLGILFRAWSPQLADATLQPVETASRKEVEDEDLNFVKIAAGIEPPMLPEGQNYRARLSRLLELQEANPEAIARLSETSRRILEKRMDHLEFQVQQEENKVIGVVGARPALEEEVTE